MNRDGSEGTREAATSLFTKWIRNRARERDGEKVKSKHLSPIPFSQSIKYHSFLCHQEQIEGNCYKCLSIFTELQEGAFPKSFGEAEGSPFLP